MRKLAVLCSFMALAGATLACSKSEAEPAKVSPPAAQAPAPTPAAAGEARLHAEGQGYTVDVTPPPAAAVGTEAKARVVLKPTGGYHVNKEFPMVLSVTPPAGVDVPKAKQQGTDASKWEETEAVFEVPFTAKDAGDKSFAASFRFAVCTATTCDPKNEKLAWNVSVK